MCISFTVYFLSPWLSRVDQRLSVLMPLLPQLAQLHTVRPLRVTPGARTCTGASTRTPGSARHVTSVVSQTNCSLYTPGRIVTTSPGLMAFDAAVRVEKSPPAPTIYSLILILFFRLKIGWVSLRLFRLGRFAALTEFFDEGNTLRINIQLHRTGHDTL